MTHIYIGELSRVNESIFTFAGQSRLWVASALLIPHYEFKCAAAVIYGERQGEGMKEWTIMEEQKYTRSGDYEVYRYKYMYIIYCSIYMVSGFLDSNLFCVFGLYLVLWRLITDELYYCCYYYCSCNIALLFH